MTAGVRFLERAGYRVAFMLLAAACLASGAHAAPAVVKGRAPLAIVRQLADRIYVAGETNGSAAAMIAAEAQAAEDIRKYIASGATDGLLADSRGQSPLAMAAYLGYPNVAAALLTSREVRSHVNDADPNGITPWMAATLSMRQAMWACNPGVFENPFSFVPMLVTQPYYAGNPVPPYRRTREVLERAGARADMGKAKEFWLTRCTAQSAEARSEVQSSSDLQVTVQSLGAATLAAQMRKAEEQKQKQSAARPAR